MNEKLSSQTIANLRFPLIMGVVFIHFNITNGFTLQGTVWGENLPAWYRGIIALCSDVLPRVAVPLFYVISGYLFFLGGRLTKEAYKQKLRRRMRSLFIPYVLWNVLAAMYACRGMLPLLSDFFPGASATRLNLSLSGMAHAFFDEYHGAGLLLRPVEPATTEWAPIDVPLWYVRDLMLMVLAAPLLDWVLRRLGWWLVAVAGAAWLWVSSTWGISGGGFPLQVLTAFFFFSLGALFRIRKCDFVALFSRRWIIVVAYGSVAMTDVLTQGTVANGWIHHVGILLGIVAFSCTAASLVEHRDFRMPSLLKDSSFFVFAAHFLILDDVGKVVLKLLQRFPFFTDAPLPMLCFYFLVPLLTIALCIGVYALLRRYWPQGCRWLTGGR